jgi:hypothetical protein
LRISDHGVGQSVFSYDRTKDEIYIAIKAYREEKLPFPDGTIIARLA